MKQNGAVLWWPGQYAESGAYDDDGNKRGFLILPDGVTVTPTGTFTTQKMKDGRNIWTFNGSSNYITASDNDAWYFGSGDFTICFWHNIPSIVRNSMFIGQPNAGNYAPITFQIYYNSDNYATYLSSSGSAWLDTSSGVLWSNTIVLNTWRFVVIKRINGYIYGYIDGVLGFTYNIGTTALFDSAAVFKIGSISPWAFMNGNMKDLMIFKGKALTQDQIAAIMKETFIY